MATRDLYGELGVKRSATTDEIKKAYRKLARKFHPDVNPGNTEAEERFKRVSFAHDVLSDPEKRKAYDEFGDEGLQAGFDAGRAREFKRAQESMGGMGGLEEGDTPPWRPLNVIAAPDEHQHGNAGMDARSKLLGKLAVDIGVNSGGYISWLAKRGYHSIGAPCGDCPAPNLGGGRDEVGNCRLEEFKTTEASVKQTLTNLHGQSNAFQEAIHFSITCSDRVPEVHAESHGEMKCAGKLVEIGMREKTPWFGD